MGYLISYLQVGALYLAVFFSICLIDSLIIHNLNHTVQLILKKPYEGRRDILKILGIAVAQVALWPFAMLLLLGTVLFIAYVELKSRGFSMKADLLPLVIGMLAGLVCEFISHSMLGIQTTIGGDLFAASLAAAQASKRLNKK